MSQNDESTTQNGATPLGGMPPSPQSAGAPQGPEVGSGAGAPGTGQPQAGQPNAWQPQAGQPQAAQPGAGQPGGERPDQGQAYPGQPPVTAGAGTTGTSAFSAQPGSTPFSPQPGSTPFSPQPKKKKTGLIVGIIVAIIVIIAIVAAAFYFLGKGNGGAERWKPILELQAEFDPGYDQANIDKDAKCLAKETDGKISDNFFAMMDVVLSDNYDESKIPTDYSFDQMEKDAQEVDRAMVACGLQEEYDPDFEQEIIDGEEPGGDDAFGSDDAFDGEDAPGSGAGKRNNSSN
ncbi:hypothetical protein SAMN05421878_10188 [Actinobaculum suis]|uniref:Uncharacterized protein n=1 Tax=Actinobaculum suis TaxID=1657 RepID=A0A1G6ZHD7_9ACTO|nr:hypothetical protein [Actinobaculum suis]MDY5153913.1 hypothetical protein [Actinobaculum suis]SDE01056.1 hypothetical protein SAMN05421878_10188 [Actinobaculum suis]